MQADLLQTLLCQITEKLGPTEQLGAYCDDEKALSEQDLLSLLKDGIARSQAIPEVYIIVDGLDELEDRAMRGLIASLSTLPANCKLLFTSRAPLKDAQNLIPGNAKEMVITPHNRDLKTFIHSQCYEPGSPIKDIIRDRPDLGDEVEERNTDTEAKTMNLERVNTKCRAASSLFDPLEPLGVAVNLVVKAGCLLGDAVEPCVLVVDLLAGGHR